MWCGQRSIILESKAVEQFLDDQKVECVALGMDHWMNGCKLVESEFKVVVE